MTPLSLSEYLAMQEANYPKQFDMNILRMKPNFLQKIQYVLKYLKKVGAGSSRVVFSVDDATVLKVAKNRKGLAQNQAEGLEPLQDYFVLAKVFDKDVKSLFIEMEKAEPCTIELFEQILNFTIDELAWYLDIIGHRHSLDKKGNIIPHFTKEDLDGNNEQFLTKYFFYLHNIPWIQELLHLAQTYNYVMPGDFSAISSYGIVQRNGEPAVVMIDYGFTMDVWKKTYKGTFGYA